MSESTVPTPHIEAVMGDVAATVLMPGDPLRAKFIAETFLADAVCYNTVRGMLGYTGTYGGKRLSVQGSGMGMPSIGIYSYELFQFYGVERIIRVGTAGAISPDLKIKDIVLAMGACTDSNFAAQYNLKGTFAPVASYRLLAEAAAQAERLGVRHRVGSVLSSDLFYGDDANAMRQWQKMNVLAVEMESAGLYMNAARLNKEALAILTISDCLFTDAQTTSEERRTAFTDMMKIALETAVSVSR